MGNQTSYNNNKATSNVIFFRGSGTSGGSGRGRDLYVVDSIEELSTIQNPKIDDIAIVWNPSEPLNTQYLAIYTEAKTWDTKSLKGEEIFTEDGEVKLSGGKTFGKYTNGATIPMIGKSTGQVMRDAFTETIPPTYYVPTVSIDGTSTDNIELGTNLTIAVTGTFTRNDAGVKTSERVLKNGAQVSTTNVYSENVNLIAPISYVYEASYAEGAVKNDNMGNPYPSTRILAGIIQTQARTYTPKLKIFYGVGPAGMNTSNFRALNFVWNNAGRVTANLITGSALKDFYILVPVGRVVTSIKDVESSNNEILSQFSVSDVIVKDAGNNDRAYKMYKWTATNAYPSSHTLLITID